MSSSRRSFLGATAATAAALATGARPADAQARTPAAPGDLPPAIKALKSMKSLATPISVDERRARIEKAKRLMRENRIDALMLNGGTSMEYFTGIRWGLSERMLAAVIPVNGSAFLVTPKFEEERAMEQAHLGPLGSDAQVYAWEEHESPWALVAEGLKARGLSTATVGAEETVRFVFADGTAHLPGITVVSATPVTAGCRMVKDAHEVALMRLASKVTHIAYEAAWKSLKVGMTQDDFARLVSAAHTQLGFEGGAGVQVGKFSALPHGSVTPQVVREGSILLMDGGCRVHGYTSDLSRTFVIGKPTQKMKDVFEIVHKAQETAVKTARPGLACEAVDGAARTVVSDGGYGPDYKFWRFGNSCGLKAAVGCPIWR